MKYSIAFYRKNIISELKSAGIKSAEIDAEILLEFVTGKSREFLLAHPEFELSNKQIRLLRLLCDRRKIQEPIAYLTSKKEFFGLDFFVTPDVLIPRPETEILVEEALKFLEARIKNREFRILDIGTGSGNIIISIADQCRLLTIVNNLHLFASDISEKALLVARKNAKKHQVNIKFIKSNLFKNISGKFDLLLTNLPYVPENNCNRFDAIASNRLYKLKEETDFEPKAAIFTRDNGMAVIKRFLEQAKNHINKNGLILVEVDPRNTRELKNYASKLYNSVKLKKDFSGIYRAIKILT